MFKNEFYDEPFGELDEEEMRKFEAAVMIEELNGKSISMKDLNFIVRNLPLLGTGENRQKVSSENRHFQSIKNSQS